MDNQHKQIKGYRDLTQEEIDLMNEGKDLAEKVRQHIERVQTVENVDMRAVRIAATELQTGFMWLTRAIARPETF